MCDTLALVTVDGVFFAKNSDRDANEAQVLDWQPAREHVPGSPLRCTYLHIEQVRRTHAVLLSRPFWIWGAEMGVNEHAVAIGNEAVFTRERPARMGLTGMDLVRLGLERGGTASEALDVIVGLLERHGQGGGCGLEDPGSSYHNSFIIADPGEAWVLETVGRRHATERIRGARAISNGLTIGGFAERHSDRIKTWAAAAVARRGRMECSGREARGVGDLVKALRDHGPGRGPCPRYAWHTGALAAPCVHGGGALAAAQTTGSLVSRLSADDAQHWATATAAPCVSIFKPVRVNEPLSLGAAPTHVADEGSLWWRHERLHRRVLRDPKRLAPLVTDERDRLEAEWLADPPEPIDAFVRADAWLQQSLALLEAEPHRDRRPFIARAYWAKRDRWAGI